MTQRDVAMPQQRQREVEDIARAMLLQSVSISAAELADRAGISWFTARDFLRRLERMGRVFEVANGRFSGPLPPEREIAVTPGERAMGLPKPGSVEESIDVEGIEGMRRAILRGARASSLIRECLSRAQSRLLSTEEIYVLLAYEALVKLGELHQIRESLQQGRFEPRAVADPDGHF